MNKKGLFNIITSLALLVQIAFPVWWAVVIGSFWFVWIEGIFEGGLSSLIRNEPFMVLWGLPFSVYCVIALVVSIWSIFSIKGIPADQVFAKNKHLLFFIINLLTIVVAVILLIVNRGHFWPRF